MNPDERWRRIESLYHAARERAAADRGAFLREVCADDDILRQDVESLLAQPVSHVDLFDEPTQPAAFGSERDSWLGRRVGPYFIWAPLGAGGMGEVYRARDTVLGRDVAVKVLARGLTADRAARDRFEHEARLLAALNHPNIAQVFGVETADDTPALIMEFVDGPTLRDQISAGALVGGALAVAKQIAAALEAAHEAGIIHRDLKPENIKVRADGTVKVLDFGIAKLIDRAASPGASVMPTLGMRSTQHTIAGTPAYMSPEQARGQSVDARADIWAFGCVLYEMLARQPAFARPTVSDTLRAVLEETPDWDRLPRGLPPSLRKYLQRCLEKDPRNRVHSIGDVRLALNGAFDPDHRMTDGRSRSRRQLGAVAAAAALASIATWILKPSPTPPPRVVIRSQIALPAGQTFSRLEQESVALSPNGGRLAYVANEQLYVRRMEDVDAAAVPGTEASNPYGATFAPDGNWLAFYSITTGRIVRVPTAGGAQLTVAELGSRRTVWGLRWTRDNTICYVDANGINCVPAAGGSPQLVIAMKPGESADAPQLLSDGHSMLFAVTEKTGPGRWDEASIVIQSTTSGQRTIVWEGGSGPVYSPSGHLLFARGAALFAVRFDVERGTTLGEPVEVVSGVARGGPAFGAPAHVSLSDTGTLAYIAGGADRYVPRRFVWMDRAGNERAVPLPSDRYLDPRLSPDGRKVAVAIERSGNADIWVLDLGDGNRTRLTEPPGVNRYPLWTLDGSEILFASSRDGEYGVYRKPATGQGQAQPLIVDTRRSSWPWSWAPDGRAVALSDLALVGDTGYDISLLKLDRDRVRTPLLSDNVAEAQPAVSPSGRWLAYRSDESGRSEIYVRPFPDVASAKVQVSVEASATSRSFPVWSRDGRELFYQDGDAFMVVSVDDGAVLRPSPPAVLTRGHYFGSGLSGVIGRQWDVSPDGLAFLVLKSETATTADTLRPPVMVVHNWLEELQQKLDSTRQR